MVRRYVNLASSDIVIQHRRFSPLDRLNLHKEKERICRELGNKGGLAYSLGNQALLFAKLARPHEALPLAEEAYRLASQHGFKALVDQIKPIFDRIRSQSG